MPLLSNSRDPLETNIPKFYLAMFFRNLWITMPVMILYFLDRGLNFTQMAIIEAVISVVIFLTDIPSGALADLWGRKRTAGTGVFLWGLSLILTGWFKTFTGYIFTGILLGLGDSMISGALSALFYDSVKQLGKEDKYLKYIGKRDAISAIAVILSAILGGFLYTINIALPNYTHGLALIISSVFIFSMQEPTINQKPAGSGVHTKIIRDSLKFTFTHPKVRFITFFWILIVLTPMIFVNLMEQPYLTSIGIPVIWFGIIYAVNRGVIGFFAPLRYKIEKRIKEKGSFYGVCAVYIVLFAFMFLFQGEFNVIWLFFLFFTRDYTYTILDKYANDHIPSDKRATILSIINFGVNLVYLIGVIGAGYLLDHLKLFRTSQLRSTLFILLGFCAAIIFPYLIWNYKNLNNKNLPKKQEPHEIEEIEEIEKIEEL